MKLNPTEFRSMLAQPYKHDKTAICLALDENDELRQQLATLREALEDSRRALLAVAAHERIKIVARRVISDQARKIEAALAATEAGKGVG